MDSDTSGNGPSGGPDLGSNRGAEDSWVLAAFDSWLMSGRPRDDIVGKVMTSFGLEDLRAAANRLYKGKWCQPQISVPNTTRPDYSRKLAEAVYDGLLSIQNQDQLRVYFWVSSKDIAKLPGVGPFPDNLAEPEVSARLTSVDNQLMLIMEKLTATERLEGTVANLAKTVTELQEQLREARKSDHQVEQQPCQGSQQSWAAVVGGQRHGRVHQLGQTGRRERSMSTKRRRDPDDDESGVRSERRQRLVDEVLIGREQRDRHPDPPGSNLSQDLSRAARGPQTRNDDMFTTVRRRRGALQKGCSSVEAEGGEKPPFSVFISGTSPATSVEIVKDKLRQCASALGPGEGEVETELNIVGVEHIKLKIPPGEAPRSKAWKVTVSPDWASHMMKGSAYPAAWGWRKWNQGPRREYDKEQGVNSGDGGA